MKFWKFLFLNSLMLGTMMAISSMSWFGMWMGLEINLLSFIPLLMNKKNILSSESALKYFIIQALASIILLFSIMLMLLMNEFITSILNNLNILILNSSLLTKMGAAPFHFWFPEIIEGLNWINSFIILTWQKIAPMVLMMYNSKLLIFISMIILISMLLSTIMSMNQTSLRKILVYSSINHIGWMLSMILFNHSIWLIYFLIYSFISFNIILMLKLSNMFYLQQLFMLMNSNKILKMNFYMNFFSLGGLPPFLGFYPKWIAISSMLKNNYNFLTIIMMFISLIMLYVYIRIMFNSLMIKSTEILYKNTNYNKIFLTMNLINLMSLGACTMIFNFI